MPIVSTDVTQPRKEFPIGRNTNTFEKKKREQDKIAKARLKLARRIERRKRESEVETAAVEQPESGSETEPGIEDL